MGIFTPNQISTQDHLEIEDIRDGLVLLRDGRISLVLETNALNFDLLSEPEQDTRIKNFASLLNSLNFQLQIIVMTERSDLTAYIERLSKYKNRQISKPLIRQIEIYMKFIKNLTYNREVLEKRFFVVIPEVIGQVQRTSMVKQIFGKKISITNKKALFEKAKLQLYPKRDHLRKQFKKMGLEAKPMNTEELIRLYYSMYTPDRLGSGKLELKTTELTSFRTNEQAEQAKK